MHLSFMRQSISQRREMILYGNQLKALLWLSLPTLMMALVQSLIPVTDGLFLNNTTSVAVAGAVGFAIPIINTLTAIGQGLSVAAMSMLGQLFGQGDFRKVKHCASQTMFYSFLLGLMIAPITALAAWILSLRVDPEIAQPLFHYLGIYSCVLPFLFIASIYNAIKSSTGQPEANFVRMVLLLILKLCFNGIFLSWLQLNEYGAVLASLCAYLCISAWMFYDLYVGESDHKLSFHHIRPDWPFLKSLIKLAIPSILSSVMISFGFFLINLEVVSFGKIALNAQTISANINSMTFTLSSAISSTITVMVSMHTGIQNARAAKKVYLLGLGVSALISVVLIAIFLPAAPFLVRLFRQEPEIVSIAVRALNIYTWSTFPFGIFMVTSGAFVGLGRMKMTLVAGVLRIWFLRYLFIKVFSHTLGVDAVFWGNLFSNCLCALIFFPILMRLPWHSVISKQLNHLKQPSAEGQEPASAAPKSRA